MFMMASFYQWGEYSLIWPIRVVPLDRVWFLRLCPEQGIHIDIISRESVLNRVWLHDCRRSIWLRSERFAGLSTR